MQFYLTAALFTACSDNDKEPNPPKSQDEPTSENFCEYVYEESFELTYEIVDDFLKKLDPNLNDTAKLQELCDWLNRYDCVLDANILCVSCVMTNPPHSEVGVLFETKNGSKELGMCISMSEPLGIATYYGL